MLYLVDFLEPNLNIALMPLVHFLVRIIFHVLFYHDSQIFLFLQIILLNTWII